MSFRCNLISNVHQVSNVAGWSITSSPCLVVRHAPQSDFVLSVTGAEVYETCCLTRTLRWGSVSDRWLATIIVRWGSLKFHEFDIDVCFRVWGSCKKLTSNYYELPWASSVMRLQQMFKQLKTLKDYIWIKS
jgi:hypothetical protein